MHCYVLEAENIQTSKNVLIKLKKHKQTITQLMLFRCKIGYSELSNMHLVAYLPSHIQRTLTGKLLITTILMELSKVFTG